MLLFGTIYIDLPIGFSPVEGHRWEQTIPKHKILKYIELVGQVLEEACQSRDLLSKVLVELETIRK